MSTWAAYDPKTPHNTLFTPSYKPSLKYNWKHKPCFNLCPPLHQWKSKTPLTSEAFDFIYSSVTENMA